MHLGHKQVSRPQSVIEGMADSARRREIAEQAADAANRIASGVAKRSADLGAQMGERMTDVAHAVAEEGHALMEHQGKKLEKNVAKGVKAVKKPRKHRLRKVVLLTGAGALAAYFLDPNAGAERRAAAMRRTSTSAQTVGDGLEKAARVAHQTADATATDQDPLKLAADAVNGSINMGSTTP